jgi:hypothetical protein
LAKYPVSNRLCNVHFQIVLARTLEFHFEPALPVPVEPNNVQIRPKQFTEPPAPPPYGNSTAQKAKNLSLSRGQKRRTSPMS